MLVQSWLLALWSLATHYSISAGRPIRLSLPKTSVQPFRPSFHLLPQDRARDLSRHFHAVRLVNTRFSLVKVLYYLKIYPFMDLFDNE
jgi:hypothetical protein